MLNLEKVQKLATKWILCSNESYRGRSTNLKLLHLCLYAELHDLLHLFAIMMGEYDTTLDLQEKLPEATRQDARGEFKIPKKCGGRFFWAVLKMGEEIDQFQKWLRDLASTS